MVPYSPSLSLKTLDTGILLLAVFTLELEMDYPSETSLCTVAPSPTDTPSPIFFWGEGAAVHRLSEMDNPSSNCPSKLMDKARQIVHSKLKLFHFQIKTYYLSDANHQKINPSHTNNPCLVWKWPLLQMNVALRPWVGRWRVCCNLLFHKDYLIIFKLTIDISMCKIILEMKYFIKSMWSNKC